MTTDTTAHTPEIGSCEECLFWDRGNASGAVANCRRHAPQFAQKPTENGIDYFDGTWPVSWAHDWCGEFKAEGKT